MAHEEKKLDKLTIISLAAQREGLSYGKYMEKYDYRPPCLEERPAEDRAQVEKTKFGVIAAMIVSRTTTNRL